MPRGFFYGSEVVGSRAPITMIPHCGACGLFRKCQTPKQEPAGQGRRRILLVGQSPGREEDKAGQPFVGPMGRQLKAALGRLGVDMRRDCWITNALICHPIDSKGKHDSIESDQMIDYCRPNLIKTIKTLKPEIIIPLGREAIVSLMSWLYKQDVGSDLVSKWVGWRIPEQILNTWICPTWHPSFVYRPDYGSGRFNEVVEMFWMHHLEQALKLEGRPWDKVPNYKDKIQKITNPNKAAKAIKEMRTRGGVVAFDYETNNRLKPDGPEAAIVCCSVCWQGRWTIAFPWEGAAIEEMSLLLKDKRIKKIASNIKFEDRWTNAILKHKVKGWFWCTMNGAHICDNRRDITSIKFQSFVRLGFGAYEEHVKPFLGKKGGMEEIEFGQLLTYCGLDSLVEYHVAMKQRRELGYGKA